MPLDGVALGAAVLLLAAVLAMALAAKTFLGRGSVVARRLKASVSGPEDFASQGLVDSLAESLGPVAKAAQPLDEEELSRLRLKLSSGGFRSERAVQLFLASKILLALGFALSFLWLNSMRAQPFESSVFLAVALFATGFYLPNTWLSSRIKARQIAIERGLPDTLDLLVTCVEAGLGLDAALHRVAADTRLAWRVLGEELEQTVLEVKAGIPRVEAFRRLAHRTGVAELKSLSATLAQTETFGTSVGLALRVQAEGVRVRRMQRAEERAGYVSVKMALPLTFCILPTIFAVILGPAAIKIAEFLPALGGGR
jgi:tight adherence protein C